MSNDSSMLHILDSTFKTISQYLKKALVSDPGPLVHPNEKIKDFSLTLEKNPLSEEALKQLLESYLKHSTNTLSPRFLNQLFSGLGPYALAGDWVASLNNATMATYEVAPMATLLEMELISHLLKKIGWKNKEAPLIINKSNKNQLNDNEVEGAGLMVTGGSNANFLAMLVARNHLFPRMKIHGMEEKKLVIFVSEEAHYSFLKAANMLGIGTQQVCTVKSDESGKLVPSDLKEQILKSLNKNETPFFVAATAGTTVLGAFDPIEEIFQVATEFKLWLHVDGAWGGSLLLSKKFNHFLKGLHLAHSFAWDAHKTLGTGLMSSFFLVKNGKALLQSNSGGGSEYIFHNTDTSSFDLGPCSLQCGRRVDALKVWLHWKSLGDNGIEKQINDLMDLSKKVSSIIKNDSSFQLVHDPGFLNICFVVKPNINSSTFEVLSPELILDKSNKLQYDLRARLLETGHFYVNLASRRGVTFFRLILANPNTQLNDIEALLVELSTLANLADPY